MSLTRLLLRISAIVALALSASAQEVVELCDMARNPGKYDGKEISVRATYRFGFEWSELYCLDCKGVLATWLEIPNDIEGSRSALKRLPKGAGIVNLTVRGTFLGKGRYGHMDGYRYQIIASRISNVVVLQKGMKSREEEDRVEKLCACGGTNPK